MITAIIQARMSSSRLPGKVLETIGSQPILEHVVERVGRSRHVEQVVVATSDDDLDAQIADFCARINVRCFRGSLRDVLDRYYRAALASGARTVVRITADCPFIDPQIIDRCIEAFRSGSDDYVANINPPTYPDGLDVEVMSFAALARAWREARLASEREHVTLFIRNRPDVFRIANVAHERDLSHHRWVVDEDQDLAFLRALYSRLARRDFLLEDVLRALDGDPSLSLINAGIVRNEGLLTSLERDVTAG